jgi:hypothetical protein
MTLRSFPGLIRMLVCLAMAAVVCCAEPVAAQLVPGTGRKIDKVGDDFEDEEWEYLHYLPKSTQNINKFDGGAGGESKNGRWYEGLKRGQPDHIRRVPTPKGGLPGSNGSLLLMSLNTGVPGRPSFGVQQDDFIGDVHYKMGGSIGVWQSPNVVVRVFMPPISKWERRTGATFAFRASVETRDQQAGGFVARGNELETYWPGIFVELETAKTNGLGYDTAHFRVRANEYGGDYVARQITETGWWTLGMSFTPDGRVHYYIRKGVEPLTQEDHVASHYPYGFRCDRFNTFFFNIINIDDGRTWSTPWIVDDCEVFYLPTR